MESELQCPICLDYLTEAVETDCGHAFCEECLLGSVKLSPHCPTCRLRITGVIPSYTLRHIVQGARLRNADMPIVDGMPKLEPIRTQTPPSQQPAMTKDFHNPPMPRIRTAQIGFLPRHPLFCSGGGFDPGSTYLTERLNEFITPPEFDEFIRRVNAEARRYTPGCVECWLLGVLLGPIGGCCLLCKRADMAKDRVSKLINESNKHTQPKGFMWAIKCDEKVTCELDEHYYLEISMDARWRTESFNTPKTRQIQQLVQENTMLQAALQGQGQSTKLIRTVSGRVRNFSEAITSTHLAIMSPHQSQSIRSDAPLPSTSSSTSSSSSTALSSTSSSRSAPHHRPSFAMHPLTEPATSSNRISSRRSSASGGSGAASSTHNPS